MNIKKYINENTELIFKTIKELCSIPAPSHFEHKRAEYCKKWLENIGAKNVYIDEALNVIFPLNCENSNKITVFAAHTDTVFPDTEPLPYYDDGEKIFCPGVCDDTTSVVLLMLTAKYFIENNIETPNGFMFVCNACEEGLGNLKGTKQLFKDYYGRISKFISFDSNIDVIHDKCVGSHRYEVEVKTEGGHSFSAFGKENAINKLSEIVTEIYKIEIPQKPDTITTYNVGTIEGGTSVNTIAQNAKMLCEYRSNDKECLDFMKQKFEAIFNKVNSDTAKVTVTLVGDRPCSDIDYSELDSIKAIASDLVESVIGKKVKYETASTDCNVPLSFGVPAICVGVCSMNKVHTREEWLDKESVIPGLEIAIKTGLALI